MSELTEAGKKLPAVSPERPAYCQAISKKYLERGESSPQRPLPPAAIDDMLQRALSAGGFLPADAAHPPTLGLVYVWGPHQVLESGDDIQYIQNLLDRAALVGGDKFAAELAKAIRESAEIREASAAPLGSPNMPGLGAAAGFEQMAGITDPVRRFIHRTPENEFLVEQASSDCYYVVVSAYDFPSLATPQKKLLWRTRLTVNARGVSQKQAFPALVSAAGTFFGKDMIRPERVTKLSLEGTVDVGAPFSVEETGK